MLRLLKNKRANPTVKELGGRDGDEDTADSSSQETASTNNGILKVRTHDESLQQETIKSNSMRRISWTTIDLHSHETVLGDNPSTLMGPPLSIGWTKLCTDTLKIDDYEEHRGERRERASLVVPCFERERALLGAGFSRSEIRSTQDELEKIKVSRAKNSTLRLSERISFAIRAVKAQHC